MHEGRVVHKCYKRRVYFGNFVHLKESHGKHIVIIKHNYTVEKHVHVIFMLLSSFLQNKQIWKRSE